MKDISANDMAVHQVNIVTKIDFIDGIAYLFLAPWLLAFDEICEFV